MLSSKCVGGAFLLVLDAPLRSTIRGDPHYLDGLASRITFELLMNSLKAALVSGDAGIAQLVEQLICNYLTSFCALLHVFAQRVFQTCATLLAQLFADLRSFAPKNSLTVENDRERLPSRARVRVTCHAIRHFTSNSRAWRVSRLR